MKNTFNGWSSVNNLDLDTTVDLILTGKNAEEAYPDNWIFQYIGNVNNKISILDFGCGVGRNTFGLSKYSSNWIITGYDNNSMLGKTSEYFKIHYSKSFLPNVTFDADWNNVKNNKYNVIFCCLVLQHIYEDALIEYISNFKKMTSKLIVVGRRFNDDIKHRSTWKIIEECGLIPLEFRKGDAIIPYISEGDINDHNTAIYVI